MKTELETELVQFYSAVESSLNAFKEIRALFDERIAFDFNVISNFFSVNENKVSDILAFFLNPAGNHAQGDKFLRLFLKHIKKDVALSNVRVMTEYRTNLNRRIDIVIEIKSGKEDILIGIENKIYEWTQEQQNQLGHYADFLKSNSPDFLLLYLTPSGQVASSHSIESKIAAHMRTERKLKEISYKEDIIPLMDQFSSVCKAENVRSFLREFGNYLRREYLGVGSMEEEERKRVTDLLKKNPAIVRSHHSVTIAVEQLMAEAYKIVFQAVTDEYCDDRVEENGFNVKREKLTSVLPFHVYTEPPGQKHCAGFIMIGVFIDKDTTSNFIERLDDMNAIHKKLESEFTGGHDKMIFPMGTYHFYNEERFCSSDIHSYTDDGLRAAAQDSLKQVKDYIKRVESEWKKIQSES